jgi:lipopolysaccharide transport system permease protein
MAAEIGEKEFFPLEKEIVRIKPPRALISFNLGDIWTYRELLYFLAWRDVKVRYKQTALGIIWVLLQPVATTLVFTILFSRLINGAITDGVSYPLFAFCGFVLWTFTSNAVINASNSLVIHSNLITKVYFPRLIMPFGAIGATLLDLSISLAILLPTVFLFGAPFSWRTLLAPIFLLLLLVLTLGVGTLLAALNVRFRDVRQLLPFALQLWMFVSPVFYSLDVLPEKWRWLWRLNPLAGVLNGFRASLLGTEFDFPAIAISVAVSGLILLAGIYVFRQMENNFADLI